METDVERLPVAPTHLMAEDTGLTCPPRSRLYPLEPQGVETPRVESFTSYLSRLSSAYRVPLRHLIPALFQSPGPDPSDDTSQQNSLIRSWGVALQKFVLLNGQGRGTQTWVDLFERLTGVTTLRYTTLLPWYQVIGDKGAFRDEKAWCPACYEEWKQTGRILYDPLMWALRDVTLCTWHGVHLVSRCPHCGQSLRYVSRDCRIAICSACSGWLGADTLGKGYETGSDVYRTYEKREAGEKHEAHVVGMIGVFLALAPRLPVLSSQKQVAGMWAAQIARITNGNMGQFARHLGVSSGLIYKFLSGSGRPRLGWFVDCCFTLQLTPIEFVIQASAQTGPAPQACGEICRTLSIVADREYANGERRRRKLSLAELRQLGEALETILASDVRPRPTLQQVAQELKVSESTLRRHFQSLRAEFARYRHGPSLSPERRASLALQLQEVLSGPSLPSLAKVAEQLGVSPGTLQHHWPNLCRAISTRARIRVRDEAEVRQRLEQAIAGDAVVTVRDIRQEFNVSERWIPRRFPDLCAALVARNHIRRMQAKTESKRRLCEEICTTVATISAQGVYPSRSRVARALGQPSGIWQSPTFSSAWQTEARRFGWK